MIKKLSKDFILYGIGNSLSKLSSIILLPFFTNYFTLEDYGALELLIIVVSLSSLLCLLQLESSLSRFFYDYGKEERKQMITSFFVFTGLLSFIVVGVLYFFSSEINEMLFSEFKYKQAYFLSVVSLPFLCWNALLTIIIRFTHRTTLFIISQLLSFILSITIPVVLILNLNQGIESFFWGQLISLVSVVLLLILSMKSEFSNRLSFSYLTSALNYSVPLIPAVAGGWINSYGSRFIMISFLSFREIGIYAAAIKIASVFQVIGSAFRMTWPQFFWKTFKEKNNHKNIFRNLHSIFSLAITLVLIFFTFYVNEIVKIFLGKEYQEAIPFIPLIAFSFVIQSFLSQMIAAGPSIRLQTKYNSYAFILGTTVNLLLLLIIIPKLNLLAVPLCFFIGTLISYVALWFFSEKLYPINFSIRNSIIHFSISLITIFITYFLDSKILTKTVLFIGFALILIFTTKEFVLFLKKINK